MRGTGTLASCRLPHTGQRPPRDHCPLTGLLGPQYFWALSPPLNFPVDFKMRDLISGWQGAVSQGLFTFYNIRWPGAAM